MKKDLLHSLLTAGMRLVSGTLDGLRQSVKKSLCVQSASSHTPIVNIADVDFSASPVLFPRRDIEHDSSLSGLKIASDKRYVAVRFILSYHNADWIQDFATHKVYNQHNTLVDRTVRGFTPVIRALFQPKPSRGHF
ncbi:hypothetical protein [Treponema vincentii]|uniref:hypothetical protein n=1 Tax=Treponema vincentii TaxID=69710 RepID=UPI001E53FB58|nr:hypothetical protein [Treponema vincentii]